MQGFEKLHKNLAAAIGRWPHQHQPKVSRPGGDCSRKGHLWACRIQGGPGQDALSKSQWGFWVFLVPRVWGFWPNGSLIFSFFGFFWCLDNFDSLIPFWSWLSHFFLAFHHLTINAFLMLSFPVLVDGFALFHGHPKPSLQPGTKTIVMRDWGHFSRCVFF